MNFSSPPIGKPLTAVLIDAENMPSSIAPKLFDAITQVCQPLSVRIYGDVRKQEGWVEASNGLNAQWVQTFPHTGTKNASDIALVVDAMDLMYSKRFQGVCIVSSDSDFTRLALRLREESLWVFGFGMKNTIPAYRQACHFFASVEDMLPAKTPVLVTAQPTAIVVPKAPAKPQPAPVKAATSPKPKPTTAKKKPEPVASPAKLLPKKAAPLITRALSQTAADPMGWVHIGPLGSNIIKETPTFSSKNYGHASLYKLVSALPAQFEVNAQNKALIKVRLKAN